MGPDDGKTRRLVLQCAKCNREIINPQINEHVSYCSECRAVIQVALRQAQLKILAIGFATIAAGAAYFLR